VPSPDFSEVLLRALKPTCAPPPVPGPPPGPGPGTGPDTTAPQITGAKLSRKRFRVGRRATARIAAKRGTAFKFTLSEAATVTIALKKAAKGRKKAGRCVKPTRTLRTRKACTRFVAKGKLTRGGVPAGAVRVKFTGRVGRRALRPGRYRAVLRATDAAGNRSAPVKLAFRVVRR
jgi:hypothetical protein